ncbi:MAG TPA: hypothetical protein VGF16_10895 [Bryobacteraceae bacterium]|jgi:hypothetical protein
MGSFRILLAVLFLFLLFARPVSGFRTDSARFDLASGVTEEGRT